MASDDLKYASESHTSIEKPVSNVDLVENSRAEHVVHFYAPSTPEEAALDKSINRKLDFIVLPLLAFNFMVCFSALSNLFESV